MHIGVFRLEVSGMLNAIKTSIGDAPSFYRLCMSLNLGFKSLSKDSKLKFTKKVNELYCRK